MEFWRARTIEKSRICYRKLRVDVFTNYSIEQTLLLLFRKCALFTWLPAEISYDDDDDDDDDDDNDNT